MSGLPYLWLPGLSGSYASAPDSVALSITSDIDIRCKVALDNWTNPSATQHLASKFNSAGNQKSYRFYVDVDGTLVLVLSDNGTGTAAGISSVASGIADGSVRWVRATWRDSDNRVQFFTSSDGVAWTQLGTDRTANSAGIFDSTALLEIGSLASGATPASGKFHRVQIRNNILDDGTGIVFDEDFTTETEGATSVTEDSVNAATVTINGFARITPSWAAAPVTAATLATTVDAASFATPSWTPKANRLYILYATYTIGAGTVTTPTCSGNTNTWTSVSTSENGLIGSRCFVMLGTGATAGATTIDFGGVTHTGCIIHVQEWDGADLSGTASAAIVQASGLIADGQASPATKTLATVAAGSRMSSGWGTTTTAATPRASWVELHDSTYATPTTGQETQCRLDASELSGSITYTASQKIRAHVLEIRPANDLQAPIVVAPSRAVQRSVNW